MTDLGIVDTKKMITAIKDAYGIDFIDYTLTTLRHRFKHVLSYFNLSLVDEFIEQVKRNNINLAELLDQLMIDTTELFRDPSLWRELREVYLPEVCKTPGAKIWMAGVSSGEEVYSLMVILRELNLEKNVRVIASCPSQRRIDRIKEGGYYDLKKMEIGNANYSRYSGKFEFSQYYTITDNKVVMDTSLLDNVEFNKYDISQTNLANNTYRLILFRNILMQYNLPLYDKVIRKLTDNLTISGYLIIGNKETLEHSEVGKKMQLINETEKIYKKRVD
jgi:chemotaxis protein methyltransferase CheR